MTRYLVLLSPDHPQLGGFTYASLAAARRSLADTKRRWPRAELRVMPPPRRPRQTHRGRVCFLTHTNYWIRENEPS